MADQKLMESFDALWLFSNLLSARRSPPSPTYPHTNPPPPPHPPPHSEEREEAHVQTSSSRDPTAETTAASSLPVPAIAAPPERAPGTSPRFHQRRTRRRSERRRRLKGCGEHEEDVDEEVLMEEVMDLGLLRVEAWRWGGSVLPSVGSSLQRTVRVYGRAASGRKSSVSCSIDRRGGDDIAVREHLRSWAHAVACTVR